MKTLCWRMCDALRQKIISPFVMCYAYAVHIEWLCRIQRRAHNIQFSGASSNWKSVWVLRMTNCLVLFFAQTDTESRLVMRSIRLFFFIFSLYSCAWLVLLTLLCSPSFPLDVTAVCRQSIKYKTSLNGDEHIIRASKTCWLCVSLSAAKEHKQTTRDSYRWDSCARNNYAHAKMLDFWVGLYNCTRY